MIEQYMKVGYDTGKRRRKTAIKGGISALSPRPKGIESPYNKAKRWRQNVVFSYQRVRYGFCMRDVWDMTDWFMRIMPHMLHALREESHGFPSQVVNELPEKDHIDVDRKGEVCAKRWDEILADMEHCFLEANTDTCSRKNPYEDRMRAAHKEFDRKYGFFGKNLMTKEEKKSLRKDKSSFPIHTIYEVPRYKKILAKYNAAEKELNDYSLECCKKGLDLFVRWFYCLND